MNYYNENLEFLKENAKQLYEILENETPTSSLLIEEFENNCILKTGKINCFMHSIYNVDEEMQMTFKNVEENADAIILFGIGEGYAFEHILKKYKKLKKLIIIEPSLEIFKRSLIKYNMKNIFEPQNWDYQIDITFIVNRDEFFAAKLLFNELIAAKNIFFVKHVYASELFKEYDIKLREELSKQIELTKGSLATVSVQWRIWLINSIKNLKQQKVVPIEQIQDIFKGKTAILVSAGPSLNKNIEKIKDMKENSIIIAVGTAIKVLDAHGIKPHFRAAIDAYVAEKKIFENLNIKNVPLLFSNQLFYEILDNYEGIGIRYVLDSDFWSKYFYENMRIPFTEFKSGPSVANGILDMLCVLNCKTIVFMGQDLSFTTPKLHARGITEDAEKDDDNWVRQQQWVEVEDIYGEKSYTIPQYLHMKYAMERTIKNYPEINFLNATEGGIGLEGAENITADGVVLQLEKEKLNFEIELEASLNIDSTFEKYNNLINKELLKIENSLSDIIEVQNEIISFSTMLQKNISRSIDIKRLNRDFDYLEKLMFKLELDPFFREVIKNDLRADLFSIDFNLNKMRGVEEEIECRVKTLIRKINRISEYITLCEELFQNN